MAYEDYLERRAKIQRLRAEGVEIRGTIRKQLAEEFGCTTSTIYADLIALDRDPLVSIHLTPNVRREVHDRDGRTCQYCGATNAATYVVEHVIPAALGGEGRPHNLVIACGMCNVRKGRNVWIPRNLDAITADHPEWREEVHAAADQMQHQSQHRHRSVSAALEALLRQEETT